MLVYILFCFFGLTFPKALWSPDMEGEMLDILRRLTSVQEQKQKLLRSFQLDQIPKVSLSPEEREKYLEIVEKTQETEVTLVEEDVILIGHYDSKSGIVSVPLQSLHDQAHNKVEIVKIESVRREINTTKLMKALQSAMEQAEPEAELQVEANLPPKFPIEIKILNKKEGRNARAIPAPLLPSSDEDRCHMTSMYFNFTAHGFDFVLSPEGVHMAECKGECHKQTDLLGRIDPRRAEREGCCRPTSKRSMEAIILTASGEVKKTTIKDFIVTSCGCHY